MKVLTRTGPVYRTVLIVDAVRRHFSANCATSTELTTPVPVLVLVVSGPGPLRSLASPAGASV